jgi:ABC-2 type transport system ATP-binding protein
MLSGLLHPTAERPVFWFCALGAERRQQRQISLSYKERPGTPARESLSSTGDRRNPRRDFEQIMENSPKCSMREQLDVMVRELSLGQRMKMELITLCTGQKFFLDELTIGLDG